MIQSVGYFVAYPGNHPANPGAASLGRSLLSSPIRPIRWMVLFGLKGAPSILSVK